MGDQRLIFGVDNGDAVVGVHSVASMPRSTMLGSISRIICRSSSIPTVTLIFGNELTFCSSMSMLCSSFLSRLFIFASPSTDSGSLGPDFGSLFVKNKLFKFCPSCCVGLNANILPIALYQSQPKFTFSVARFSHSLGIGTALTQPRLRSLFTLFSICHPHFICVLSYPRIHMRSYRFN